MKGKVLAFFKKILAPNVPKPITVTSPPSKLPPALAGVVVRNRTADTSAESNEFPAHVDFFATLLDLANKGVIAFEVTTNKKGFIIRKLNAEEEYSFERILTGCIPSVGYENLSRFLNSFNIVRFQFRSAIKEDALNYGLYYAKVSSNDLTELGVLESANWKEFRRYILDAINDKYLAAQKTEQWVTYLPYAAEFFYGRAWIKIFADLNAISPHWFKADITAYSKAFTSSSDMPLKYVKNSLIKMGNKVAEPYFDW